MGDVAAGSVDGDSFSPFATALLPSPVTGLPSTGQKYPIKEELKMECDSQQ
jgi:hypothetical protein